MASVLGFAYWALAARLFSQQAVGYGSAAVSAMTLLGTVGMLGLGTVLIGELPRRKARAGLISAALVTCGAGSLLLGIVFALAAPQASARFADISGTAGRLALFAVGVSLTGVTLVFDQAAIGLMRGGLQLSRNSVFAAVKLARPAGHRGHPARRIRHGHRGELGGRHRAVPGRWSRSGCGRRAHRCWPAPTGTCCAGSAAPRWRTTG